MSQIPIKEFRDRLGITQEELSRLIGVSCQTINRWEKGHYKPSKLALDKINNLLRKANG